MSYVECSVLSELKSPYHVWNTRRIEVKGRQFSLAIMPEHNKHHYVQAVNSDSSPHEYQHMGYHWGVLLSLVIVKYREFVGYSQFFLNFC
jgi:hypothetical protein